MLIFFCLFRCEIISIIHLFPNHTHWLVSESLYIIFMAGFVQMRRTSPSPYHSKIVRVCHDDQEHSQPRLVSGMLVMIMVSKYNPINGHSWGEIVVAMIMTFQASVTWFIIYAERLVIEDYFLHNNFF